MSTHTTWFTYELKSEARTRTRAIYKQTRKVLNEKRIMLFYNSFSIRG